MAELTGVRRPPIEARAERSPTPPMHATDDERVSRVGSEAVRKVGKDPSLGLDTENEKNFFSRLIECVEEACNSIYQCILTITRWVVNNILCCCFSDENIALETGHNIRPAVIEQPSYASVRDRDGEGSFLSRATSLPLSGRECSESGGYSSDEDLSA